jgi:exodeoxyribonuclease VII small subunit
MAIVWRFRPASRTCARRAEPTFYPVWTPQPSEGPKFLPTRPKTCIPLQSVRRVCRDDYNSVCPSLTRWIAPNPTPADPSAASFEDAQAELDELVRAMETGQMPLDGLLSAYKRGAQLLEFCRSRLDAVEEQVKVLEEGQLKPWTRP